jgi:hypothetical protein
MVAAGSGAERVPIGKLCADLRAAGHQITLSDEIRATLLCERLAALGRLPETGEDWAHWLVPVLARDQQGQVGLTQAIAEWWAPPSEAGARSAAQKTIRHEAHADRVRRLRIRWALAAAVVLGLSTLSVWLIVLGSGGLGLNGGGWIPDPKIVVDPGSIRRLPEFLVLYYPFVGVAAWLALRLFRPGWMVRMRGKRLPLRRLTVPEVRTEVIAAPEARLAAHELATSKRVPSRRLDARRSIAATIRAGGLRQVCHRRRLMRREYVIVAETRGARDHISLVTEALTARLLEVAAQFVLYEALGTIAKLRHRSGVRSRDHVADLSDIAEEHRGARLILVGTGATLFDPFTGALSQTPGFAKSGMPERVFGSFELPTLLSLTPVGRWGDREAALEAAGMTVLPATSKGLLEAAVLDSASAPDRRPNAIAPGRDEFLARLDDDEARLCSDVPPPEAEADRLARRIAFYMGDAAAHRLLYAMAFLPDIFPKLTGFAALFVLGEAEDRPGTYSYRPMPEDVALRLARLPWMRRGRMPNWLRHAIDRTLGPRHKSDVVERLGQMMAELDDQARAAEKGENLPPPRAGERFRIDRDARLIADIAARFGMRLDLLEGEGVVERGRLFRGRDLALRAGRPSRRPRPELMLAMAVALIGGLWLSAAALDPVGAWLDGLSGTTFVALVVAAAASFALQTLTLWDVALPGGSDWTAWWRIGARWRLRRATRALRSAVVRGVADETASPIAVLTESGPHGRRGAEADSRVLVFLQALALPGLLALSRSGEDVYGTLFLLACLGFILVRCWPAGVRLNSLRNAQPRLTPADGRVVSFVLPVGVLSAALLLVYVPNMALGYLTVGFSSLMPVYLANGMLLTTVSAFILSRASPIFDGPTLAPRALTDLAAVAIASVPALAAPAIIPLVVLFLHDTWIAGIGFFFGVVPFLGSLFVYRTVRGVLTEAHIARFSRWSHFLATSALPCFAIGSLVGPLLFEFAHSFKFDGLIIVAVIALTSATVVGWLAVAGLRRFDPIGRVFPDPGIEGKMLMDAATRMRQRGRAAASTAGHAESAA